MAKRSPTAERHADLIRTALFEVAPAGMTMTRLMASCELSRRQTRRGLSTLRDLCAERSWPPVIFRRRRDQVVYDAAGRPLSYLGDIPPAKITLRTYVQVPLRADALGRTEV
ncbi:hypothetical protein ACFYWX_13250 [Streptomyces sp. NPDC002888]|uniref:hypothetical protein n=1 Tax=Streptomyces sp. NPDC002888 TaxID=3364668 RepID=UPI0036CA75A7